MVPPLSVMPVSCAVVKLPSRYSAPPDETVIAPEFDQLVAPRCSVSPLETLMVPWLVKAAGARADAHDGVPQPDPGDAGDRQRGRRMALGLREVGKGRATPTVGCLLFPSCGAAGAGKLEQRRKTWAGRRCGGQSAPMLRVCGITRSSRKSAQGRSVERRPFSAEREKMAAAGASA
jgi:hypothetical protein